MRNSEQIEISIENTKEDIKKVVEFMEFTLSSNLQQEIKNDFKNRLTSELSWLYQIIDDEENAINFLNEVEEAKADNYRKYEVNENTFNNE